MKKLILALTLLVSTSSFAAIEQCDIDRESQEEKMCVIMQYGEEENFNSVTVLRGEDCYSSDEPRGIIYASMTSFTEKFGLRKMSSTGAAIGLSMELLSKKGRIVMKTGIETKTGYIIRDRFTFTCN